MKLYHFPACALAALMVQSGAFAQDLTQYDISSFRLVCRTASDSGRVVSKVLTEHEIVKQCAQSMGITNSRALRLVFVPGADDNGDIIQVVNKTNYVFCVPFRFLFQKQLPNTGDRQAEKFAFFFTPARTDPSGSASLSEKQNGNGRWIV